jgi:hypothetical protein
VFYGDVSGTIFISFDLSRSEIDHTTYRTQVELVLSQSEINQTTYRTQVELVCPDLRSTTRPIVPKSSWFVSIWDQPHDLPYPSRVGLSRSEINNATYRAQVELVCPDLISITRPIVPRSSWFSRSKINHTTYRTQVELVCPDLRSTTRPIIPKTSWFVPIWNQPHDLSYPIRVGLSRSQINHTTYRTQVELVSPDLRTTIRPIVPK